jgi:hypothetical protein
MTGSCVRTSPITKAIFLYRSDVDIDNDPKYSELSRQNGFADFFDVAFGFASVLYQILNSDNPDAMRPGNLFRDSPRAILTVFIHDLAHDTDSFKPAKRAKSTDDRYVRRAAERPPDGR